MGSASADVETISFDCTGGARSWVVPDDVTSATFELWGAKGGATDPIPGGLGGHVQATIAVTPGETIQLNVGCDGGDGFNTANGGGGSGGYPDGGDGGEPYAQLPNALGGAGGGGSSDIRRGGTSLADRELVAGGGGGFDGLGWGGASGGGGSGLCGTGCAVNESGVASGYPNGGRIDITFTTSGGSAPDTPTSPAASPISARPTFTG